MRISVFILLGFLVILTMFTFTTYINFRLSEQVSENSEWLAKSTVIVRSSNRYQRNILNMFSGVRGYLFSGEDYFVQAFDSAAVENEAIFRELQSLIPRESVQQASLKQIHDLSGQWIRNYARPLIAARRVSETSDSTRAAYQSLYRRLLQDTGERSINNRLNTRLRNFINYEYSIRDARKEILERTIVRTRQISIYLTSFSIITGLLIAIYLAQRISRRIIKMVTMANTIARGDYDVHMEDIGKDELGKLAESLNHMAGVLSENISLLKRKNNELDQFAHIVSHDMKAPLRGIDNVVTWIEEDHLHELSPKVTEYLGLIRGRITRGENLINGILSYSRVGQYEVEPEEVDIRQLLEELRETFPEKPPARLKIQPDMPVLRTQRVPLMQVFSNLVQNAIKYSDKPIAEVTVSCTRGPVNYTFHVRDNGPGIAKAYHGKIFEIFQTLNGSDTFQSTGVGLAIVKKILDDRDQKIELVSAPGEGAVFSFTWPKQ